MSLDTVLKIGKALRSTEDNLKYFKYVNSCPKDKDGTYSPFCISIPVLEDFTIDWNNTALVPENIKSSLFFLKFKTSDGDSSVKYIFGDIHYVKSSTIKKDGSIDKKEGGYYRLGNPEGRAAQQKSSFERGETDMTDILKSYKNGVLSQFHSNLDLDLEILEKILSNISGIEAYFSDRPDLQFLDFLNNEEILKKAIIKQVYQKAGAKNLKKLKIESELDMLTEEEKEKLLFYDYGDIFIHFDFPNNTHWYQFETELELITKKMLSDFVENSENGKVFKKTLYKTICSGDKKNDWQFPGFTTNNKHKSKAFSDDDILDLFYAIDYSSRGRTISGTDIKIITLPRGENLKAKDFEDFSKNRSEEQIKAKNELIDNNSEPLFDLFEKEGEENITSFDVIFCKKGGTSSPDVDLIEISGIEKSKIRFTRERLEKISNVISIKRKKYLRTEKKLFPPRLEYCFKNILGSPQFDQKTNKVNIKTNPQYQSHLLKVLPKIYIGNYHADNVLLPAFIQKIEFSIRAGDNKFNLLKFDIEYLLKIQNSQNDTFMKITNSKSYQIGILLGELAKNLSLEIKSFEKNYVGNLTRRVSSLEDFIRLKNDIEQKLIMHDKTKYTFKSSYELSQQVKDFEGGYDKEECAFGFFESYFKPFPKKEKTTND